MKSRDIPQILQAWNRCLSPADRHDKYCKMGQSPFGFYRGSNHLFWMDFIADPRLRIFGDPLTRTWLQGDMHCDNMGAYHDARERTVYGLNDFDDALIGDYQLDLWRLAVSLVLVARQNGLAEQAMAAVLEGFAGAYLEAMLGYAGNDRANRTCFTKRNTCELLSAFLEQVERENTRKKMLKRWTEREKHDRFFALTPDMRPPVRVTRKLAPISESERIGILAAMPRYRDTLENGLRLDPDYFAVEDIARRLLAGTGSTGVPRYYVLIEGPGNKSGNDRILDVKRQSRPTAYHFFEARQREEFDACFADPGKRHAAACLALTTLEDAAGERIPADIHLGWMPLFDGVYSVRERSPRKETFPAQDLDSAAGLRQMAEQWAIVLATAHARAHHQQKGAPPLRPLAEQVAESLRGREQAFRQLVKDVALGYADQVEADWRAFRSTLAPDTCG